MHGNFPPRSTKEGSRSDCSITGLVVKENMLAYIPPATRHNVTNSGSQVFEYVWVVTPTAEQAK